MAEKCGGGGGLHSVECLEKTFAALQRKIEEDFSQVEGVQRKVKALSLDWEERHQRLKIEQEKVAELEAQIKLLNAKQEEALASLQADVLRAATQIQEKEGLAEQLRAEVASLEERVRVACQEAAGSAAELEKGAHEARLALEATLQQLAGEEVARQTSQVGHEALPPRLCEQFLCGRDTEEPGKAEGAEAATGEALRGQPQEAAGGLLEEVSSALLCGEGFSSGSGGAGVCQGCGNERASFTPDYRSFLPAGSGKATLARGASVISGSPFSPRWRTRLVLPSV